MSVSYTHLDVYKRQVETEVVWEDQNFRVIQSGSEENRLLETWREMERELKGDQKSDTYGAFFPRFESVRKNVNNWLSEVERILPNYVKMCIRDRG